MTPREYVEQRWQQVEETPLFGEPFGVWIGGREGHAIGRGQTAEEAWIAAKEYTEANEERVRQLREQIRAQTAWRDNRLSWVIPNSFMNDGQLWEGPGLVQKARLVVTISRTLALLESELAKAMTGRRTGETQ